MNKSCGCLTMEKMDNREVNSVGSSRIRVRWLLPYWPEAEEYVIGKKYSTLIFQKVYWGAMMKAFEGIKILDLCVSGDTLIFTDEGWKYAKEVKLGDKLLTHKGEFEPVKRIFNRKARIRQVKTRGLPELNITFNHKVPFLNLRYDGYGKVKYGVIKHKRIEELRIFKRHKGGDCLLTLIQRTDINQSSSIDEQMGWFWGYYSAEGSRNLNGVTFSMNGKETRQRDYILQIIKDKFHKQGRVYKHKIDNTQTVTFSSREISRLIKNKVGSHIQKTILPELFYSEVQIKLKFLEGYIAGDGYCDDYGGISVSSCSKKLAYSAWQLFIDCGYNPTLNYNKRDGENCVFKSRNGKVYQGNPCWRVQLNPRDSIKFVSETNIQNFKICKFDYWESLESKNKFVKKIDKHLVRPVNEVSEDSLDPVGVYNFTVGESHSYIVDGLVVLNCDSDWLEGKPVFEFVDMVDAVTTSTEALAGYIRKLRPKALVKCIPDRVYLPEAIPVHGKHEGQLRKLVWFGYSHNSHYLYNAFDEIINKGLELTAISDAPVEPTLMYKDKINIVNIPYSYDTVNKEIVKADAVLMPEPFGDEKGKYKSNNKTLQAKALRMPVIKTPEDLERFMSPENREVETELGRKEVEEKHNVKFSVVEYGELIREIKSKKTC